MSFEYAPYHSPYIGSISELMQRSGEIRAQQATAVAAAQARAAELSGLAFGGAAQQQGQAWAGAAQQLGQIPGQIAQVKSQQLQQQDVQAQIAQRSVAAKKAAEVDQANGTIDQIMQTSMKADPDSGVMSFDRPTFEAGLVKSGLGHLYPALSETLDKLDASAAKRSADGRTMLAHSLLGIQQAGYTSEAVLSAAAYLKANHVITADHLTPVLSALADDPSPEHVKQIVMGLGQQIPEYQSLQETEAKRAADLAKTQAETGNLTASAAKTNAEVGGTLPQTPAQVETARHNLETERIGALTEGKAAAAQAETARHNRAMEAQAASVDSAAPTLTDDALKLTAHQFAMTGQLPPMGMGKQGAKVRTDIINAAADEYKNLDLPSQVAAYKANQASLTNVQGTLDTLTAFENTAGKNLKQFTDLAAKIPDSGVPWLNVPMRALSDKVLGSPDMVAAKAAGDVALREIARVTNDPKLSGVLSDSARTSVNNLMASGSATLPQLLAVAKVLQTDMANVHSSMTEQKTAIQQRIATPPGGTAPAGPKMIQARDPQGVLHQAPAGTALPAGWTLEGGA